MATERHDVLVVGAGFAGLGCAAALRARGVEDFAVLKQGADVGHFAAYRDAAPFAGQRVMVVGSGNSAWEAGERIADELRS